MPIRSWKMVLIAAMIPANSKVILKSLTNTNSPSKLCLSLKYHSAHNGTIKVLQTTMKLNHSIFKDAGIAMKLAIPAKPATERCLQPILMPFKVHQVAKIIMAAVASFDATLFIAELFEDLIMIS